VSKEQYDQLNAELDAANFELQSAQENLTKAQENLSKAQEDLTQIEDEYDTLLSEKNAKELELETKRLELEGLSDDKNVTDAELALKRAEYEQLWAELNGTSDNVTAKALELEQAREALNSTLDDMAGIVDERDHYWAQYNETLAQYNETKDRLVLIDDLGRTVTIPTTPRRIVSIASSVTETLYALDAGDLVVGRDTYSTYPPEVTDKPDVGSSFGLSVEMVVGLEPDMVFCWWYATSAMDSLENVGITTFAINPRSVEEVLQTIRMIGLITNHTVEAETLTGEMQQELDGITDITDGINKTGRPLVYYELSTPMKTTGPGTFTNELIFMAGGINLAADEPLRYPILSSEYIIGKDPDVIVIVSYGTSVDDVKARDGWSNITAVKDDRVYTIDTNWVTCNPRLILGLEQFAEWFHPDKFS
jgi:iron complex transport system substrate-binding protein